MNVEWIAAFGVLAAVVVVQALATVGLLRRLVPVLERAEAALVQGSGPRGVRPGLEPGMHVPAFQALGRDGRLRDERILARVPAIVLFVGSQCEACEPIILAIRDQGLNVDGVRLILVIENSHRRGDDLPMPSAVEVLYDPHHSVSQAFETTITPNAFAIGPGRAVVGRLVPGSIEDLRKLAGRVREEVSMPTTS